MWFYALVVASIVAAFAQSQILSLASTPPRWSFIGFWPDGLSRTSVRMDNHSDSLHRIRLGLHWLQLLAAISILTIIGWAWVYVAQLRWMCRHIEGTQRDVTFNATGLEFLWRAVVTALACAFIIPSHGCTAGSPVG